MSTTMVKRKGPILETGKMQIQARGNRLSRHDHFPKFYQNGSYQTRWNQKLAGTYHSMTSQIIPWVLQLLSALHRKLLRNRLPIDDINKES